MKNTPKTPKNITSNQKVAGLSPAGCTNVYRGFAGFLRGLVLRRCTDSAHAGRKAVLAAAVGLVLAAGAFGQRAEAEGGKPGFLCGAPQPIYGIVSVERFGMRLPVSTRVELRTFEGDLLETTLSNPFGWYRFENVLPCQNYSVRAMHKRLVFAPSPVLAAEFDGKGVRRDVFEIVSEKP